MESCDVARYGRPPLLGSDLVPLGRRKLRWSNAKLVQYRGVDHGDGLNDLSPTTRVILSQGYHCL
jgi:hypothetical protein